MVDFAALAGACRRDSISFCSVLVRYKILTTAAVLLLVLKHSFSAGTAPLLSLVTCASAVLASFFQLFLPACEHRFCDRAVPFVASCQIFTVWAVPLTHRPSSNLQGARNA